ncbi:hypothetical protein U1Q18_039697 [Sarracenia purpurea var. burkii]
MKTKSSMVVSPKLNRRIINYHDRVHTSKKKEKHWGDEVRQMDSSKGTIDAVEVDEGWLKNCAVGIIKEQTNIESIQEAMKSDGVNGISIKALGENKALIIFSDDMEKKAYMESYAICGYWNGLKHKKESELKDGKNPDHHIEKRDH